MDLTTEPPAAPAEPEKQPEEVKISQEIPEESKSDETLPAPEVDAVPLDLHRSPSKTPAKSEPDDSLNKSTDSKKSTASDNSEKKRRKRKPNVTKKVQADEEAEFPAASSQEDIELKIPTSLIHSAKTSPHESDAETIDKIAQMVSSITEGVQSIENVAIPPPPVAELVKVEDEMAKIFGDDAPMSETVKSEDISTATTETTPAAKKATKRKAPAENATTNGDKKPRKKRKPAENGKKSKKAAEKEAAEKKEEEERKSAKEKKKKEKQKTKSDVAPFVKIHKDGNFSIINQIVNGDDENGEKATGKTKKSQKPEKKIRGLHVSTLSNKYDADKRDLTWICVFCKLGPHKHKLGDLFGPYIVNQKSEEFRYAAQDPATDPFRQTNKDKFKKKVITPEKLPKKKKKSLPETPATINGVPFEEVFDGMSRVDDDNHEVWFHEDCIAWSDGVHMIGPNINGMEAAIWSSTRYRCIYCSKNGAMMTCLERECKKTGHFGCARKDGWRFTDEFKTFCGRH